MRPLRIGVLGASRIAKAAIVGPAAESGHRLVAVAARDRGRAEVFAATYGVERVHDSYADVIADPDVDLVYNPLANALHAPWNLAAVQAGKPVLTEKPFARNAAEAESVLTAARSAGVTVTEGFHYLFHPVTRRMQALRAGGTLGRLRRVEVVMRMPEPKPDDPRWSLELAGGAVMDLGCYGLHVHRLLASPNDGPPWVVAARASERSPGIDEWCDIDLAYPGGATGSSINSMIADEFEFTLRIVGERGEALAHNFIKPSEDDRVTVTTSAGSVVEHLGTRTSYAYQLDAVAEHVLQGAALPMSVGDSLANMTMIDDAYRAAGLPLR
ncbi:MULTISPECIES: Gfo/Idh/MocA family protein [unclassified Rhodococcus (in: high G+C Gram-positive bacteria)]|uniref:Gfo/Idh/MocA family protein n=1 Tax=unclassified Rhodococcus (in: high G+C Gram-positive bacteria) TaxID=192944 RepID=UPI00163971FF|nr:MULTISPECIES: Gfo/Idh/MocA family oxidoreductase [unclassified Rhodococcus (in: high G+C Gram-positive bacteria)]MBC2638811.1 Gfo/Idh/MocA family oxidoreductase [Rhodococcus sp. 3A]MBC2896448.1 Gfo/Idh/MocA family oxidoreductase [Rhodococcus sp. 4CII]